MEQSDSQLNINQERKEDAPSTIWKTPLGRAIFGFYCETRDNSYFVNDDYIQALCNVQNRAEANYGKTIVYAFVVSILSIATANDAIGDAGYFGLNFNQIPYLTEFCSLSLSVFAVLIVFQALDIFTMTRMRIELFSLTTSEHPNMRMLHLKGNNAWIDALIPKRVGYQSHWLHRVAQAIGLSLSLVLPVSTILLVFAAQAICVASVLPINEFDLSDGIVWAGILISVSSITMLFLTALIPLKFTFQNVPRPIQDETNQF